MGKLVSLDEWRDRRSREKGVVVESVADFEVVFGTAMTGGGVGQNIQISLDDPPDGLDSA